MSPTQDLNRMLACIAEVNKDMADTSGKGSTLYRTLRDEYGYEGLGEGHYSAVFNHPADPTKVIKIGGDTKDAWLGFAMYVRENPAACFPQIDNITIYSNYYVAVMEKLTKFGYSCQDRLGFPRGWDAPAGGWVSSDTTRYLWTLGRMRETAAMFKVLGTQRLDLHSGNFMMRGDQLVITDPFYNTIFPGYDPRKYKHGAKTDLFAARQREKDLDDRLAVLGQGPETRGTQEDQTLRWHAVDVNKFDPARVAGILPPMQRKVLGSKRIAHIARGSRRVPQFVFRNELPAPSVRLRDGVRGFRPDVILMDELATPRRDWRELAQAVPARVDKEAQEGGLAHMDFNKIEARILAQHIAPNFVHALDARFLAAAGIGGDVVAPAWVNRPQVPVRPHKPGNGGLPEFRRKHWERGNKLPRGLRYNRGRAERDQGGAVRAVGSVAGHEPRAGKAGPGDQFNLQAIAYHRAVGRPGQGGANAEPKSGKITETARFEYDMVGFT